MNGKRSKEQRRRERREAERAEARRQERKEVTVEAEQPNEYMEAYMGGFRCGYLDAYAQLIEDLLANTTVQFAAAHMMVLPDDKVETARHVLRHAQKALRPRNAAAIENGLATAWQKHMAEAFQDLQRDAQAESEGEGEDASEATG